MTYVQYGWRKFHQVPWSPNSSSFYDGFAIQTKTQQLLNLPWSKVGIYFQSLPTAFSPQVTTTIEFWDVDVPTAFSPQVTTTIDFWDVIFILWMYTSTTKKYNLATWYSILAWGAPRTARVVIHVQQRCENCNVDVSCEGAYMSCCDKGNNNIGASYEGASTSCCDKRDDKF